jgi:hypothetical protein
MLIPEFMEKRFFSISVSSCLTFAKFTSPGVRQYLLLDFGLKCRRIVRDSAQMGQLGMVGVDFQRGEQ